jgi:V8-like Glu-specific endopeptidase
MLRRWGFYFKKGEITKRVILLLSILILLAPAFHSSAADEVSEIGSVTAIVTSEEVREGDSNADKGEARNQSHFPENPELYIPMPFPQGKEYGESSTLEESGWVSYDVSTGEEFICESPLMNEDVPITSRSKGGIGLRQESKVSNGSFLNFTDLTRIDNPEDYPWSVNCKLFIETLLGTYVCSGVLIDPLHVLTAGHCVYSEDFGGWPIGITVVPGYEDGSRPYGDTSLINLHAPLDWINYGDFDHDMGIITLDRPIGAITGWHGYSYNNDDSFFLNNTFNNPGYPAAPPYDGEFMYYWFGNYDYILNPFQVGFFQQAYGGQSGSGSYYFDGISGRWVYAVLSNGNDIMTNHVRITPVKFSNISDIIANNTPSTFDLIPLRVRPSDLIISAGEQFASMEYLVHNYSYASWSGTVNVNVYLSDNINISPADTLIQSHNFTWGFDPKSTVLIDISPPPTIPADTPEGFYWIGVILDVADYNILNNESDGQDAALIYVMPNVDLDNDGIPNDEDNCPNDSNPLQEDTYPPQGNGIGNACDCECDFNCDGNVDAGDVTGFLTDFGRSWIFNPCANGNPCNGDCECDTDVDSADVEKLLEDFGRSWIINPCPACVAGDWCVYP